MKKILLFIETWFPGLYNFVKHWPGTSWMIGTAVVLWIFSDTFLRWLDPTAGTFDAGVLQGYVYAALGIIIGVELAFYISKLNFFGQWEYYTTTFKEDFQNLTAWQKQQLILLSVLGLLYCFVHLVSAILGSH